VLLSMHRLATFLRRERHSDIWLAKKTEDDVMEIIGGGVLLGGVVPNKTTKKKVTKNELAVYHNAEVIWLCFFCVRNAENTIKWTKKSNSSYQSHSN
jgi:hypothetical protein